MASNSPDFFKYFNTPEGKKYAQEIEKLLGLEVQVGFQAGENDYEDGTSLVEVAAYNEFGTSDTPARPFMKQSFENNEKQLRNACITLEKKIVEGGTAQEALQKLGAVAKGIVQKEIRNGTFEPNKPSTIKRKGSDHPLIDTGHMRQSVQFVIDKKGSADKD